MFPSEKKEGAKKEKNRMKVKMKVVNMLPSKFFSVKVKMMKNEEDKRVLKHKNWMKKLDESKDDVKMKKNESMFGSKSILDEEKWMKAKMRRTRACTS